MLEKSTTAPDKRQSQARILLLPAELQLTIINHANLTVMDRVCLALTCKTMARILVSFPPLLRIHTFIKHGHEECIRECHRDWSPAYSGFSEASDDEDSWSSRQRTYSFHCDTRVEGEEIDKLFKRLDSGWNQSQSRYCTACGKFVSTCQAYWDRKQAHFSFRSNSNVARAWRRGGPPSRNGLNINYGEDARAYAARWVRGEVLSKNKNTCPICKVLEWEQLRIEQEMC